MDTKRMDCQAENYIKSELSKYKFNVTKPDFDEEGCDLLIVKCISQKRTSLIKVQCKGRSIREGNSSVTIPIEYVTENFITIIYIVKEQSKESYLYVFLKNDIEKWNNNGTNFILSIPQDFEHREKFKEKLFKENIDKIQNILDTQEVKLNYSMIIDGIFLGNAVKKTRKLYKELYPEKKFKKPSIDNILKQCLEYVNIDRSKEIDCYVIESPQHFDLRYFVDIPSEDNNYNDDYGYNDNYEDEKLLNELDIKYKIIYIETNKEEFVYFKIEERLKRIINTENIILLADDNAYNPLLSELKNKGIEIILFHYREENGSNMYHQFKWGNIIYPLALSMGLNQYEL